VAVRVRRGRLAWLSVLVLLVGLIARPSGASAVGWAPSSGVLLSEVVTGAASASDEMVELYNASVADIDLGGLELVYVTSSGATVTRKQTWTALQLPAHRHLLVANSAGAWSAVADGTYSGGLSATGGSLVLRTLAGTVIDSLSWGDAASSFVETHAGAAPPAGSSLERNPGGAAGNGTDSNDNLADTALNPSPVAQALTAAPVPPITATPTPSQAPVCSWAPLATPGATPSPASTASPSPTAYPVQAPIAIAMARTLPTGALVTLSGQLTTALGLLDGGSTGYLDDGTGGMALHLDSADWPLFPAGTFVSATGVLGERHGEMTLLLGSASDIAFLAAGTRPSPLWAATGLAREDLESRLIAVQAWVTSGLQPVAGCAGATVDDGTGPLNVVVPLAVLVEADGLAPGNQVELIGVLSQVEQTADGYARYALIVTASTDIVVLSRPATPTPTPTPTPSPTPSPSPTASPTVLPIADARLLPLGAHALVRGVVTVEPGRILGDSVFAIEDGSAGIYVRLPDDAPSVALGEELEVGGSLAAPYGNLELRPATAEVRQLGAGAIPAPRALGAAEVGEATEGLLAQIVVFVDSVEGGSSGSLTLLVHDDSGSTRVFFHAPLGVDPATFRSGQRLRAIGLVGDRLGLYRLWPRDLADVTVLAEPPTPRPTVTPTPRPSASATPGGTPTATSTAAAAISIADALRRPGATVTVTGTVTTKAGLLDADGQRVTLQDGTAAILVRLPQDFATQVGRRLGVTGEVGTYYGAPQLTATRATNEGAASPAVTDLHAAPIPPSLEWRLVTVSGTIESVHRDGDAWRAELTLPGGGVPIVGLARSGIASTALEAGRAATITGIVKRAYPTASDQRLAIVPRSAADIRLGAAQQTGRPAGSSPKPGTTTPPTGDAGHPNGASPSAGRPSPRGGDVPLAALSAYQGTTVRVGGAVTGIDGALIVLADSSGSATLELVGRAAPLAATLAVDDLVNATGTVVADGDGLRVVIDDPAKLDRFPAPGQSTHSAASSSITADDYRPPDNHLAAANPAPSGPIVAFLVVLGMSVLLVVGALAIRLGWPNRILSRLRRI